MSDEELKRWSGAFHEGTAIPKALRADVARQARRRWVVSVMLTVILLGETGDGIAVLATDDRWHGRAIGGFLIGLSAIFAAIFLRIFGTGWVDVGLTPEEVLAAMARRVEAGLKMARVGPWFATFGALGVAALIATADVPVEDRLPGLVLSAAIIASGWIAPRFGRRRLMKRAEMIRGWREGLGGEA
jgi:hypothetical protein